jgi:hypothetical protein
MLLRPEDEKNLRDISPIFPSFIAVDTEDIEGNPIRVLTSYENIVEL